MSVGGELQFYELENKMKVSIVKKCETKHGYGEVEYFPYQFAFGISIRYFSGGWMFRLYIGQFKIWFNLRDRKCN